MKNKTFFHTLCCAYKGLLTAFKIEKNYKIYLYHVLCTLPINIILHFSFVEFFIYGLCIIGVFSAECFNTAIENICDFLTKEYNEQIKIIKDIAAAGVLCWGIAFYLTEAILIIYHVIN